MLFPKIVRFLLLPATIPLSLIYRLVTYLRNLAYDQGIFQTYKSNLLVISVGNLTIGGTGKTPHVVFLTGLLHSFFPLAILSRGYGRSTKGFRKVAGTDSAHSVGDESLMYRRRFGKDIEVYVDENRANALRIMDQLTEKPRAIILDDAFQHRKVLSDVHLLLTDYGRLFYNDHIIPLGLLRESRSGASRAHAVIVTKSPENLLSKNALEAQDIRNNVLKYAGKDIPVFFSTLDYGPLLPVYNEQRTHAYSKLMVFCALANPKPLIGYLSERYQVVDVIYYADHHEYTTKDACHIRDWFKSKSDGETILVTTEKDMVKLMSSNIKEIMADLPVFYQPIEMRFLSQQPSFENWLLQKINGLQKENEGFLPI